MNYASFGEWVLERVEDLVQFGVPRAEAEALLTTLECGAVSAESRVRNDDQFLLDLRRHGTAHMATRMEMSEAAIRKRRARILRNSQPRVAVRVAG